MKRRHEQGEPPVSPTKEKAFTILLVEDNSGNVRDVSPHS